MSKRITKIENFNCDNVITLNQHVTDRRYLTFDLWIDEMLGSKNTEQLRINDQRYNQIFLQINSVKVVSINNGKIYFDLSGRREVINSMTYVEDHLMGILKSYLAKMNKKGNFNFCSVIKCDESTQNTPAKNNGVVGSVVLALNIKNDDYEVNFYDREKRRVDSSIVTKPDSVFNIIIEITHIHLDMVKGDIVVDTRLRMMLETHIRPARTHLTSPDSFLDDEKPVNKPTMTGIKQSFDVTQTEVFDDSDSVESPKHTPAKHMAKEVNMRSNQTRSVQTQNSQTKKQLSPVTSSFRHQDQAPVHVPHAPSVTSVTNSGSNTKQPEQTKKQGGSASVPNAQKTVEELEMENANSLAFLGEILSLDNSKKTNSKTDGKQLGGIGNVTQNVNTQKVPGKTYTGQIKNQYDDSVTSDVESLESSDEDTIISDVAKHINNLTKKGSPKSSGMSNERTATHQDQGGQSNSPAIDRRLEDFEDYSQSSNDDVIRSDQNQEHISVNGPAIETAVESLDDPVDDQDGEPEDLDSVISENDVESDINDNINDDDVDSDEDIMANLNKIQKQRDSERPLPAKTVQIATEKSAQSTTSKHNKKHNDDDDIDASEAESIINSLINSSKKARR